MLFLLAGCTPVQKGAGVGAVAGGALGGIIGSQSGSGGTGAAIGAAVGGITGAVVAEKAQKKFCPVCGATYSSDVVYCPKDGTELKDKTE
ncbi:MAG: hypothetical protein A2Z88_09375 [Omnitrophica WOR_2 bacterium GWA2_47_8]|nr:MAG: hypothetical protein A2Z88_09375 [Omnitrophica WOR_2 bacterium GWA2_47_8]